MKQIRTTTKIKVIEEIAKKQNATMSELLGFELLPEDYNNDTNTRLYKAFNNRERRLNRHSSARIIYELFLNRDRKE